MKTYYSFATVKGIKNIVLEGKKMKFEIKCKECDSIDCVVEEMIDYDWEENPISDGYIIYCRECGNEERI